MTSAVNAYVKEYAAQLPKYRLTLASETIACAARRSLLLNHVIEV